MNVYLTSLGCDKNLTDAEVMLGKLISAGYKISEVPEEAQIIIVNTCCFIGDAQEESVNTILEMSEYKRSGSCKVFVVTGCLAERFNKEIIPEIPEVDCVLGTACYDEIVDSVEKCLLGEKVLSYGNISRKMSVSKDRVVTTGGHYAFLKIAEGCNKCCSYCVIPSVRGHYRSFPMEDLVSEAKRLVSFGVKELILVAQETTVYGKDIYGYKALPELIRELAKINDLKWIRILYCYPEEIDDEFIKVMQEEPKLCHYIDMPIQHASDKILKAMGRRTNNEEISSLIKKLRTEIPDIVLRTTFISGFPGETDEDHELLKSFVTDMKFNRMGAFAYSREEGTPAAGFNDQIDVDLKILRRDELMLLQKDICAEYGLSSIGKIFDVIIEGYLSDDDVYVGRTYMDAPDVDGYIFVESPYELLSGDFVKVKAEQSLDYDLIGVIIDE